VWRWFVDAVLDQLVAIVADGALVGHVSGVEVVAMGGVLVLEHIGEALVLHGLRRSQAGQVEQRGHDVVKVAKLIAFLVFGDTGAGDDQRHLG
jgi:hypothetical protein